ncbi:hypothetical protein ABZ917_13765 [Nonomuraea wenchangensis]
MALPSLGVLVAGSVPPSYRVMVLPISVPEVQLSPERFGDQALGRSHDLDPFAPFLGLWLAPVTPD